MINLPLKVKFNNNYHFEVINTKTNKIRQIIDTHNIVVDNFWTAYTSYGDSGNALRNICLGSGMKEPSYSDVTLEAKLWESVSISDVCTSGVFSPDSLKTEKKYPVSILTFTFTIPAAPQLVGKITEIGFVNSEYSSRYLLTHALLKDAEGNPISIDKTDIDKIIITIKIEVIFESLAKGFIFEDIKYNTMLNNLEDNFILFKNILRYINYGIRHLSCGSPHLLVRPAPDWSGWNNDPKNPNRYWEEGVWTKDDVRGYFDPETRCLSSDPGRILTDQGNIHYFNALAFPGIGYWQFPNYDIFPPQTLSNIKVGTGDGIKTEFKCPLNLFIKDTDKLYKNGILLTRNVDYTIEHDNNQDALVELSMGNFAELSGPGSVWNSANRQSIFKAHCSEEYPPDSSYGSARLRGHHVNFYRDKPLFLACKKPEKCNTLRLVKGMPRGIYTLSYSDDAVKYTECFKTNRENNEENRTYSFDLVTAKYWKIECDYSSEWSISYPQKGFTNEEQSFIGYVGKGIIFKEPPSLNDVITMEAQIDRPFKNENFVIDMSVSITF